MSVELLPVPKKLGVIKELNPHAFVASYKLETDEAILASKATMSLQKYQLDMVIANLLATYRDSCTIYSAHAPDGAPLERSETSQSLEALIIEHVLAVANNAAGNNL